MAGFSFGNILKDKYTWLMSTIRINVNDVEIPDSNYEAIIYIDDDNNLVSNSNNYEYNNKILATGEIE